MKEIHLLLQLLDEAYDKRSWHGANLRGSIRRVSLEEAAFRPGTGRHNIWELLVHAAYWKYAVRRRLLGEKRGSFPLKGSDWFRRPEIGTAAEWKSDVSLLEESHRRLRRAVEGFDPRDLRKHSRGSVFENASVILGAASHDLYHAGQIQLLKKLARR